MSSPPRFIACAFRGLEAIVKYQESSQADFITLFTVQPLLSQHLDN